MELGVLERGLEGVGVFRAELEDVADLDAALDRERLAAARADVAVLDDGEVGVGGDLAVAFEVDVVEVVLLRHVAAGDHALGALQVEVGVDRHVLGRLYRAGVADRGPGHAADGVEVREREALRADEALRLDLVQLAVAAHAEEDRLAVREIDERLHHLRRRQLEERDHLLDRLRRRRRRIARSAKRGLPFRRFDYSIIRRFDYSPLRLLQVRGVSARGAGGDAVLAGLGEHVELVGELAADVAGVGLDRHGVESAPREDALVGAEHRLVARVRRLHRHVERVGVLHQELL